MKLVVISGPESSGKTTLLYDLAAYYRSNSVEEYAREYLENLPRNYEFRDLLAICRGQEVRMLSGRQRGKGAFLFVDTWALVLMIWAEIKFGKTHACFNRLLSRYEVAHFLLCSPDIPWVSDPLRENPNDRENLFQLYREKMEVLKLPFSILEGDRHQKFDAAQAILDSLD